MTSYSERDNPLSQKPSTSSRTCGKEKEDVVEDDDLYCLQSTFVYFQVERHIFHIPTYRFKVDSDAFSKQFQLPQTPFDDIPGTSRQNPIILKEVLREDFRNFLKALYPLDVLDHLPLSKAEWVSVLRLSTRWYFRKYRLLSLGKLESGNELSSTDKILLGREMFIHSWIFHGYTELVLRQETIDKEEALAIGFPTTFSIFRIRESRILGIFDQSQANEAIREDFENELDVIMIEETGLNNVNPPVDFEGSRPMTPVFEEPQGQPHMWGRPGVLSEPPDFEDAPETFEDAAADFDGQRAIYDEPPVPFNEPIAAGGWGFGEPPTPSAGGWGYEEPTATAGKKKKKKKL